MNASQLSVAFFLQMAVILAVCRLVGALARRLGQPQVVGEMIAPFVVESVELLDVLRFAVHVSLSAVLNWTKRPFINSNAAWSPENSPRNRRRENI